MILIVGPSVRINDHELRYLARAAAVLLVSQAPPTPEPQINSFDSTEFYSSLTAYVKPEEPPPEPHINGNLRYLYRSPVKRFNPVVRRRYTIHQPCWRSGRWKSLT